MKRKRKKLKGGQGGNKKERKKERDIEKVCMYACTCETYVGELCGYTSTGEMSEPRSPCIYSHSQSNIAFNLCRH